MAGIIRIITPMRATLKRAGILLVLCPLLILPGCADLVRGNDDARRISESENDRIRDRILEVPMSRAAENEPSAVKNGDPTAAASRTQARPEAGATYFSGDGPLINENAAARSRSAKLGNGTITFNFVDTAISEVVRTILGDLLDVAFVIDAKVQGTITAQSKKGLSRDAVIAVLSNLLRAKGAALTYENGIYQVLPAEQARRGASPPRLTYELDDFGPAYGVQIVPLEYVAVSEMAKVLQTLGPGDAVLNIDKARNLLVLGGNGAELANMLEIVDLFDVDWLAGTAFALYQLEVADAVTVIEELGPIFGEGANTPVAGLVRFMPITRLNTVLAMSPRAKALRDAMDWVRRLDQEAASSERTLHVYYVQNGRAADLADLLQQIFDTASATGGSNLAPGLQATRIASAARRPGPQAAGAAATTNAGAQRTNRTGANQRNQTTLNANRANAATNPSGTPGRGTGRNTGQSTGRNTPNTDGRRGGPTRGPTAAGADQIKIIADEANNALVIMATGIEYRRIEAALRKLDVEPLQVVIEATIAEVTLNDQLRYGVQWFLQTGNFNFSLSDAATGTVASLFPGFSGVYQGSAETRAVINALSSVTDVNVISSPQLMVLDNQTAVLQVGDQVPVATQSAVTTIDPNAPIVNSIEFRDTGVILQVTPRVNASGLVTIDIVQEVSDVVATTTSGIDSPTIQQRSISSTVAVKSGETVILGGLIRDSKGITKTGFPVLKDIPLLGALFRDTNNTDSRTELMVLLTPKVVRNAQDARDISEDLRRRFRHLAPVPARESKMAPNAKGLKGS